MHFDEKISHLAVGPLGAYGIEVLQVNLGYKCNMACRHCHVTAGSGRSEEMGEETIGMVLDVLGNNDIRVLDLTGGAPELNPRMRYLVEEATRLGVHVIVRTNLTVFFEEGMEDMPEFYEAKAVEIIASLPCYTEDGVDRTRGKGAFQKSMAALRKLSAQGYGDGRAGKRLGLVYNPPGMSLPPPQGRLEEDYRRSLLTGFGITFDKLYTFSNMPVGRFRAHLVETNNFERYMGMLAAAFNVSTLDGLMCRHQINVGWDGRLYDCDFNQMLGIGVDSSCPQHIKDFSIRDLAGRKISVGDHCYGCTAGQGST